MRIEQTTVALLKRAIDIYLDAAWGDLAVAHFPRIDFSTDDSHRILGQFLDERRRGRMRRFALRLGNRRYPFMKLVFQESLLRDVFFFAVDTHDEMDVKETTPDYSEWLGIRAHNAATRERVEEAWREAAVPTYMDMISEVERLAVPNHEIIRRTRPPHVLVVDDDRGIAHGVRLILERRGYAVDVAHCGEEALPKIKTKRPDVILSDYELGNGINGVQLCERVRALRGFEKTPFILATAADVDPAQTFASATGYMVKPFEIDVLVTFIARHIAGETEA